MLLGHEPLLFETFSLEPLCVVVLSLEPCAVPADSLPFQPLGLEPPLLLDSLTLDALSFGTLLL